MRKSVVSKLILIMLIFSTSQIYSEVIFTLSSGGNIAFTRASRRNLKPGPSLSGDLAGEIKVGSEFKLGIGGVSDYSMFFVNNSSQSGVVAFYTIGPIIKPMFKLKGNIYSITEVAAGYTLKHAYGTNIGWSSNAFGFTAGTGLSFSRFVFGGKYRMAVDDVYAHKWINIYIGVRL